MSNSTVKALQKASSAGQRIYHITPANQASTLPNIHHDADTLNEIEAALATGKEVITHTDAVSVPGWSGAGYIIFDPVTGEGAYKIGGAGIGGRAEEVGVFDFLHAVFEKPSRLFPVCTGRLVRQLLSIDLGNGPLPNTIAI